MFTTRMSSQHALHGCVPRALFIVQSSRRSAKRITAGALSRLAQTSLLILATARHVNERRWTNGRTVKLAAITAWPRHVSALVGARELTPRLFVQLQPHTNCLTMT